MGESAKALMNRLFGRLAKQVPKRNVYGRSGPHLHPGATEPEILVLQRPSMSVHLQCGFTEQ